MYEMSLNFWLHMSELLARVEKGTEKTRVLCVTFAAISGNCRSASFSGPLRVLTINVSRVYTSAYGNRER